MAMASRPPPFRMERASERMVSSRVGRISMNLKFLLRAARRIVIPVMISMNSVISSVRVTLIDEMSKRYTARLTIKNREVRITMARPILCRCFL